MSPDSIGWAAFIESFWKHIFLILFSFPSCLLSPWGFRFHKPVLSLLFICNDRAPWVKQAFSRHVNSLPVRTGSAKACRGVRQKTNSSSSWLKRRKLTTHTYTYLLAVCAEYHLTGLLVKLVSLPFVWPFWPLTYYMCIRAAQQTSV